LSLDGAVLFEHDVYITSAQPFIRIDLDEKAVISDKLKAGVYLLKIENKTGSQVLKVVRM